MYIFLPLVYRKSSKETRGSHSTSWTANVGLIRVCIGKICKNASLIGIRVLFEGGPLSLMKVQTLYLKKFSLNYLFFQSFQASFLKELKVNYWMQILAYEPDFSYHFWEKNLGKLVRKILK